MKRVLKIKEDVEINQEDMWSSIETPLKLFLEETFEGKFSYQLIVNNSIFCIFL